MVDGEWVVVEVRGMKVPVVNRDSLKEADMIGRIILILAICLFISGNVFSQENKDVPVKVEELAVSNTVCPVMGNKVSPDTPFWAIYEGKKIGFCCAKCKPAFEKDPKGYMSEDMYVYDD